MKDVTSGGLLPNVNLIKIPACEEATIGGERDSEAVRTPGLQENFGIPDIQEQEDVVEDHRESGERRKKQRLL